jgi:hypothetical protein
LGPKPNESNRSFAAKVELGRSVCAPGQKNVRQDTNARRVCKHALLATLRYKKAKMLPASSQFPSTFGAMGRGAFAVETLGTFFATLASYATPRLRQAREVKHEWMPAP